MSINISLSSKSPGLCEEVIYKFLKSDIDAKFIKTSYVSLKNVEYGCDIIISKSREKHIPYLVDTINQINDKTSSIKIDYSG